MAKLKKKVASDTQLSELNAFLNQYFPENLRAAAIKEAKETGQLSPATLAQVGVVNPSTLKFVQGEIGRITGGKPAERAFTRTELERELAGADATTGKAGKPIDEASLTDEELTRRRDLFETLGGTKQDLSGFPSQVQDALKQKLTGFGVRDNVDALSGQIFELSQRLGHYPSAQEMKDAFGKDTVFSRDANKAVDQEGGGSGWLGGAAAGGLVGGPTGAAVGTTVGGLTQGGGGDTYVRQGYIPPELENFFNDQNARNELSGLIGGITEAPDTSADISRLDELLGARKEQAARESEIESFISGIPGELAGPRNERINLLRELGGRQFEAQAPGLLAKEAAMGRFNSGAAGDVLANAYGDIEANVESEAARLKSGDDDFYFNAAYQNQIRKLMEGRANLGSSLATERQNIRQGQEQRFQSGQFDLNANLQNDMLMQKYENQLQAAQRARQRQQDLQSKANRLGTTSALTGLATGLIGGAAGAAVGGPAGAGLGYSVGSGVGTGLPVLFGAR